MPIMHQSGAIVIRRDRKTIRVLLVTTKRSRENWIFPKGHIEKGETPEAAAMREVKEEAGVVGKLIGPAGAIEYGFLGAKARVEYFLAELSRETGPPEDGRSRLWCEVDEALERLSHKSTRKLLRQVWRRVATSAER